MAITKHTILIIAITILAGIGWWLLGRDSNTAALDAIAPRVVSEAGITIIAFGDSLTAGYGLPAAESYPAQLEARLVAGGYDVRVINAGVSGETTRGNLERAMFIREQDPDIVLLGIGGNDALRRLPLDETKQNLSQTIETLQGGDEPPVVILLAMQAPLTAGLSYKRDFDAMYEELADRYALMTAPFITTDVFLDNSKKLPDGIHLNRDGYAVVAGEYLFPVVTAVLDRFTE